MHWKQGSEQIDFLCKLSTVISNASLCGLIWLRKDIQTEFFVEHGQVSLRGGDQFGGQSGQDTVIVSGVIAQGMTQLRRHQASVAHAGEQVIEAGNLFVATGELGGEPGADATAQGDEIFAAQFFNETFVFCLR